MRTEYVTVTVEYSIPVTVEDDATNAEVLDAAEEAYSSGELGVLCDHDIDPDGEFSDDRAADGKGR